MATVSLPIITALTAAVLALLSIKLTLDIVKLRRAEQVAIGDGGHDRLAQAIRIHGNFAEHAPITLIVLMLAEMLGTWWPIVLLTAFLLVAGRCAHARMFKDGQHNLATRSLGMKLNLAALLVGSGSTVVMAIWHLL
jgi:hypothetical protein